jgi:hypothetical protein
LTDKKLEFVMRKKPEGKNILSPLEEGHNSPSTGAGEGTQGEKAPARLFDRLRKLTRALGEIIYGMTIYDMVRELHKARGSVEHLFVLIVFGDLLGVPIMPPYYSLRLLPYIVPSLSTWRRSMLRERDLTDLFDQEIG